MDEVATGHRQTRLASGFSFGYRHCVLCGRFCAQATTRELTKASNSTAWLVNQALTKLPAIVRCSSEEKE
jgi:hypothetical protein